MMRDAAAARVEPGTWTRSHTVLQLGLVATMIAATMIDRDAPGVITPVELQSNELGATELPSLGRATAVTVPIAVEPIPVTIEPAPAAPPAAIDRTRAWAGVAAAAGADVVVGWTDTGLLVARSAERSRSQQGEEIAAVAVAADGTVFSIRGPSGPRRHRPQLAIWDLDAETSTSRKLPMSGETISLQIAGDWLVWMFSAPSAAAATLALSRDQGRTWTVQALPDRDGFTSGQLSIDRRGRIDLVAVRYMSMECGGSQVSRYRGRVGSDTWRQLWNEEGTEAISLGHDGEAHTMPSANNGRATFAIEHDWGAPEPRHRLVRLARARATVVVDAVAADAELPAVDHRDRPIVLVGDRVFRWSSEDGARGWQRLSL